MKVSVFDIEQYCVFSVPAKAYFKKRAETIDIPGSTSEQDERANELTDWVRQNGKKIIWIDAVIKTH